MEDKLMDKWLMSSSNRANLIRALILGFVLANLYALVSVITIHILQYSFDGLYLMFGINLIVGVIGWSVAGKCQKLDEEKNRR